MRSVETRNLSLMRAPKMSNKCSRNDENETFQLAKISAQKSRSFSLFLSICIFRRFSTKFPLLSPNGPREPVSFARLNPWQSEAPRLEKHQFPNNPLLTLALFCRFRKNYLKSQRLENAAICVIDPSLNWKLWPDGHCEEKLTARKWRQKTRWDSDPVK